MIAVASPVSTLNDTSRNAQRVRSSAATRRRRAESRPATASRKERGSRLVPIVYRLEMRSITTASGIETSDSVGERSLHVAKINASGRDENDAGKGGVRQASHIDRPSEN